MVINAKNSNNKIYKTNEKGIIIMITIIEK